MYSMSPAPPDRVDVLVLASHAPELVGLRSALTESLDGRVRGLRVMGKAVGIGLPVAAGGAAGRISSLKPRAVILLGTCGVYPGLTYYRPHDVVIAGRIALVDHAALSQRAAFPDPMQTTVEPQQGLATGLVAVGPRTRLAPVASTLAFTTDDQLATAIHTQTGCEAENLEAFSVGLAASLAQVPFAAVLGVTHITGSRGRDDWKQFQRQSSIAAAEVILAWAHNGAVGLPHS